MRKQPSRNGATLAIAATLALALGATAGRVRGAPSGDGLAPGEVDPAPLEGLFGRHVHRGGVDYRALARDESARRGLRAFLDAAAGMPEDAPLASWLNVYNALVIQGVLAHYPLDSVQSVPDFFGRPRGPVAGEKRSLDDIEHRVVRPRFEDARVHMALNCAARSCPPLAPRPYRQADLDATLDARSRKALGDPRVARLEQGVVHHSKLFDWFEKDFVREAGSVRAWMARYADGPLKQALGAGAPLKPMEYDWALNDRTK